MTKELSITREQAIELLKKHNNPEDKSDWNHFLESEAIMKEVAKKLGKSQEEIKYWAMLGLLHDIDWGLTKNDWKQHCVKCEEILKQAGFDNEFIQIIQSHGYGIDEIPEFKDKKRNKDIEYALAASETITGLIYAYALMRGNKISDMKVKGLKKKFKDKTFASGCSREIIKEIENTGISLEEFFKISINALNNIKQDIGLN